MNVSGDRRGGECGFNITPIVDIVFLLMIFFLVESRFIEAENWPVTVPGACRSAESRLVSRPRVLTVTVMNGSSGDGEFAFGSEKIASDDRYEVAARIARLIDGRLGDDPSGRGVVTLRIDGNVRFSDAQYALLAVSLSGATDVEMAVAK
jgi:biopolymer transport protein ExbD